VVGLNQPYRDGAVALRKLDPLKRTATEKWPGHPNLRLRPHARNKGRGRLQRQIRRAFIAHGDEVSASDIYRWFKRWQAREFGQWERWSITRVLMTIADPIGRAETIGRLWLWRLRNSDLGNLA
jgi:hypothetical protein